MDKQYPLAYLITFTCYGTWLHGNEGGSVDRYHSVPGTPFVRPDTKRVGYERTLMDQPPYELDAQRRCIVRQAMIEVCENRGWDLMAVHVRTRHVHSVVQAAADPEKVMNDWKSYASRHLNEARLDPAGRKRWTRKGSKRYLWKESDVKAAIHYVLYEQGEPMVVYNPYNYHFEG